MAVYRFRVLFEDYEDVFRDIEVKSVQTFEDLHNAIMQSISFDGKHMASFYMSDEKWRKGLEISLMDVDDEESQEPKLMMKNAILADHIDDPHQKIVYVFDFLAMWTFYIELIKIMVNEEPKATYPRVVKSGGDAPKQYKTNKLPDPDVDDDEEPGTKKKAKLFEGIHEEFGLVDALDEDDELPEGFDDGAEEGEAEGAHEEHE